MFRRNQQLSAVLSVFLVVAGFLPVGDVAFAQNEKQDAPETQVAEQPAGSLSDPEAAVELQGDKMMMNADRRKMVEEQRQKAIGQENEKEQLRKSALAGLLVLSLICVVFLVLIILVALWARRIRMLTRQPLPEQHPGDPLWYLRKGKTPNSPEIGELIDDSPSADEA